MTIRPRTNSQGEVTSWILDYGIVDGERKRERYDDEATAKRALEAAEAAQRNLGLMGLQATPVEMAEFLALKARLPQGTSILQAARQADDPHLHACADEPGAGVSAHAGA